MSKKFISTEQYGDLEYDEIFLYYDGPCIFSVKNKLGYRFICLLESESSEMDRYLVVPVSIERYNAFIRNNWPIRNLFTEPEQGGVFLATFVQDDSFITSVNESEIERLNLPDSSEMLEFNDGYTTKEILLNSADKNIPILQKSLEKYGEHRQYIYANDLAKESLKFQKVFDGIANDEIKQMPGITSERRAELKQASKVPICGTYAASFGIQIEGTEYPRIGEEESDFSKFLKVYFKLLDMNETADNDFLEKHQEALIALKGYYKTLISLGFSAKFSAATPKHDYFRCIMSRDDILNRYNFLNCVTANDVEQITLIGTWAQIDIEKKTFRFRINTGENINGKFDDDFDESIFNFSEEIRILVDKKKSTDRTGDESEKYN